MPRGQLLPKVEPRQPRQLVHRRHPRFRFEIVCQAREDGRSRIRPSQRLVQLPSRTRVGRIEVEIQRFGRNRYVSPANIQMNHPERANPPLLRHDIGEAGHHGLVRAHLLTDPQGLFAECFLVPDKLTPAQALKGW